jgi:hypothetical protein
MRKPRKSRKRPPISPKPELVAWWRAMKRYEGQFPLPRPAELRVP